MFIQQAKSVMPTLWIVAITNGMVQAGQMQVQSKVKKVTLVIQVLKAILVQGSKGDKGETGATGQQGEQGPKGDTGPAWPIGNTGATGAGLTIKGSYDSYEELIAEHPQGSDGDSYLVNGSLYVWNGNAWENIGNIRSDTVMWDLKVIPELKEIRVIREILGLKVMPDRVVMRSWMETACR